MQRPAVSIAWRARATTTERASTDRVVDDPALGGRAAAAHATPRRGRAPGRRTGSLPGLLLCSATLQAIARSQSAATAPAPERAGHLPVLDGVRGLAIAMVLLLHFVGDTVPTSRLEQVVVTVSGWGQYGVDLFFVLSGFLITGILFDARRDPHYFRNFYVRRVLRIFPLYYAVLAALFFLCPLLPALRGPTLDTLRDHQAWAWLYGVNVYNALRGEWALPYIDHFWSLAVEEHFYLVWPFVVWLLARRPRMLLAASLSIAAGALLLRIGCSLARVSPHALYVLTPFRLDGLALGATLAFGFRQPGGRVALARALPWVAAGAAALFLARFGWSRLGLGGDAVLRPVREALITVLLACVLVWALVSEPGSRAGRFFRHPALAFLGTYSYGLYVYHHFISYSLGTHRTEFRLAERLGSHGLAVLVQASAGIALSLLVAVASYRWLERPFLSLKDRFAPARARPIPDATPPAPALAPAAIQERSGTVRP
jgi:peptidoglycan/LPS O-acetylase OafA/YrhL